jgi:hypothetical protein
MMTTTLPTKPTKTTVNPLKKWFTANTTIPTWFPKPLQHVLTVYAAASCIQLLARGAIGPRQL